MTTEIKRLRHRPFGREFPGAHFIDDQEIDAVAEVLRARSPSRFFGIQPQNTCERLERAFCEYVGLRFGVATCSGTGALHVALAALGVGPGQEVIVPGYLWINTVAAVINRGAIPVLCEVDDSFCMDPEDLVRKITPRASTVIAIHMSGATGNLEQVCAVARARGLKVLEDCAQAAGGSYRGRKLGTFGDIAIFSFQVTKALTTGEGGIAVTDDPLLFKRCQAAMDVGHSEDFDGILGGRPTVLWGVGAVMSELQGAMGLVQLAKLDRIVSSMRRTKYTVREALLQIPGIGLRRIDDPAGDNGAFLITRYRDRAQAAQMATSLRALGLECGPDGRLVHHLPEWGFHIYSNIPQLVHHLSTSSDGFPWTHPLNAPSRYDYALGALPRSDELFSRSVLQIVPSNCTDEDIADLIAIYRTAAARM